MYSAVTQISVLICFFCRNTLNKQKTNRKNIWTAAKQYFIKMMFLRSWLIPFEGISNMYFFTDIFTQFFKILKTLFCNFLMAVLEKIFMLLLNSLLIAEIKVKHSKFFQPKRTEGTSWQPSVYLWSFPTYTKR